MKKPIEEDEPVIEDPIEPQEIDVQQRKLVSAYDRPDLAPQNFQESLFKDYAPEYNVIDKAADEKTKLMSTF